MANWKYTIDIKQYLDKGEDLNEEDDVPAEIKDGILKELEKAPPLRLMATQLKRVKTVKSFNNWISRLYNVADMELVWCGL